MCLGMALFPCALLLIGCRGLPFVRGCGAWPSFGSVLGIWASCRYNEKSYMCVHKNILYASKRAEATWRLHVQSR